MDSLIQEIILQTDYPRLNDRVQLVLGFISSFSSIKYNDVC